MPALNIKIRKAQTSSSDAIAASRLAVAAQVNALVARARQLAVDCAADMTFMTGIRFSSFAAITERPVSTGMTVRATPALAQGQARDLDRLVDQFTTERTP